jgi:3-phenylpropionate/trans-cinnamate dioxygenase ferredoxin reductase subunit
MIIRQKVDTFYGAQHQTLILKIGGIMPDYKYLIIGGGMTGNAAVKGIREVDAAGSIGLIGKESDKPYNRPPLTKQLWKGKPLDSIWRSTPEAGVTLHLGRAAQSLDANKKQVIDDQGTVYTYEKLLLATGGTPRTLPFGDDHIIYYRNLNDYRTLRQLADQHQHFAVIGSGFIGSEIAAALSMNGKRVTMIFPEKNIGERLYPSALARFVTEYYRQKGVEVWAEDEVTGVDKKRREYTVQARSGRTITVDAVVAGIGIQPNVALAESVGAKVENGVIVDEYLQTTVPDLYAAGDLASFMNPALNRRMRVEHQDNANTMGKLVGLNMAGKPTPYHHLPFFYSDLFDLGYEAVGELDSRLEIVEDWKEPNRKGVIYYLRHGQVRGVLLWDVWGKVDEGRELISQKQSFKPIDLKGKIAAD